MFTTVYSSGAITGLALGQARSPGARIVGNLSATFDPATGFTNGKIGGGAGGGMAVEIGPSSCKPVRARPEHSEARGTISALSTSSITVAGLTCVVPSNMATQITTRFKSGDRVEIRCGLTNGQNTLTRIAKHR